MLNMRYQLAYLGGRRRAEVDDDVRMQVGNLRIADAMALQSTLIDQSTRADVLDLLEDRSGARMDVEPRVTRPAPREVLLEDLVHPITVTRRQREPHCQRHIAMMMQDARVVSECHVVTIGGASFAALG